MAKKRSPGMVEPAMYSEPSPKQEFSWALDRAVEKAVLAHPRTQKLREVIKSRMVKAAGSGEMSEPTGPTKARTARKA